MITSYGTADGEHPVLSAALLDTIKRVKEEGPELRVTTDGRLALLYAEGQGNDAAVERLLRYAERDDAFFDKFLARLNK